MHARHARTVRLRFAVAFLALISLGSFLLGQEIGARPTPSSANANDAGGAANLGSASYSLDSAISGGIGVKPPGRQQIVKKILLVPTPTKPRPTPTPTSTPSPIPTPTQEPTPTPPPSPTPTATPMPTPLPTPLPSPTPTPTPIPSPMSTPTPTSTPGA